MQLVNIDEFKNFALATSFTEADFEAFKNTIKSQEQNKTQRLDVTYRTDHSNTYNGSYHSNSPGSDHSNSSGGSHSNTSYVGHVDEAGSSASSHENAWTHNQNGTSGGGHWDVKHSQTSHTNYNAPGWHGDVYTQYVNYSQSSHGNSYPHSQYTTYTNSGFEHQNYIPSLTYLYQIANSQTLVGVTKIGLYSYDKNIDGYGSQDSVSKTVKYTLQIRRLYDLKGNSSPSGTATLLSNANVDEYFLDSKDPLNTGAPDPKAEGYYQITVWASNDTISQNGVSKSYVGDPQTVYVTIRNNVVPTVSVTNSSEIVKFSFGIDTVVTPNGTIENYSDIQHADKQTESQNNGLLAVINMTDTDLNNYQKGKVNILNSSGQVIQSVPINWQNGSDVISSNGNTVKGYAFINKDALKGDYLNAVAQIEVHDYLDSACTQDANVTKYLSTISDSDATVLNINIDKTNPNNPVIALSNKDWSNLPVTVTITGSDNLKVLRTVYKLEGSTDQDWKVYNGSFQITNEGQTIVKAMTYDEAGNVSGESIQIISVDKTGPSVIFTPNGMSSYQKSVNTRVVATDDLSDIGQTYYAWKADKNIPTSGWTQFTNGSTLTNNDPTDRYLIIKAVDKAGNITYTVSNIFKIDNVAPIVNAPTVTATSSTSIQVKPNANDEGVGLNTTPYLYNKNGTDVTSWVDGDYIDTGLTPNTQYSYKYKAKDILENTSAYSSTISKYTLANSPINANVIGLSKTSAKITFNGNDNPQGTQYRAISVPRDGGKVVDSGWITGVAGNNTIILNGLDSGKIYGFEVWAKNGDNIETAHVTVQPNRKPTISLNLPSRLSLDTPVDWSYNYNDEDGNPLDNLQWTLKHFDSNGNLIETFNYNGATSTPPVFFKGQNFKYDGLGKWEVSVRALDGLNFDPLWSDTYTAKFEVIAEMKLTQLQVTNVVNPIEKLTFPINLPVNSPIKIKSGSKVTFGITTDRVTQIKYELLDKGVPVPIYKADGVVATNTIPVKGDIGETSSFTFFVDSKCPKNEPLDLYIELSQVSIYDGSVTTTQIFDKGAQTLIVQEDAINDTQINLRN